MGIINLLDDSYFLKVNNHKLECSYKFGGIFARQKRKGQT